MDQIPFQKMVLPALVISSADPVSVKSEDVRGQPVQPGMAILFQTENSRTGRLYSILDHDLVFLSPGCAKCCLEMGASLVGIDSMSVDRINCGEHPVHHMLLGADIPILEGIDLSGVPPGRYELICLPLNITGGEAAPARALLLEMGAN